MVKICFNTTPKYFAENVFSVLKIISKNIEEKLTLNLCKSTGYSIFLKSMNLSLSQDELQVFDIYCNFFAIKLNIQKIFYLLRPLRIRIVDCGQIS